LPELPPARAPPPDGAARPEDDPFPADAAARAWPNTRGAAAAGDAARVVAPGAPGAMDRADPAPPDAAPPRATDPASFVRAPASAGTAPRGGALTWLAAAVDGFAERASTPLGHGTRSGSGGLAADCLSRASRGRTAGAAVFVPRARTCPGHGTRCGSRAPAAGADARRPVPAGTPAGDAADVAGLPLCSGNARDAPVAGAGVPAAGLRRGLSVRAADLLYVGATDAPSPISSPRR
jgi:hypothetical protein